MEEYDKIINKLNCIFESYKKYMLDYLKKDNLEIYPKTSLMFSVLQRSVSMIDAYSKLIKTNNIMVLNSIARTQIDNCIFIYGVYLLINNNEDINDIYHNFITNNKKLSDYKIEKHKLYDTYIVSKLNEVYDEFEDMYKFYCRFIHCSDTAFLCSTKSAGEEKVEFSLSVNYERYYKQCLINADTFCELSKLILVLINKFWITMEKGNRLSE